MTNINMLITVTREQQIEIEEYCTNVSMSTSEYFLSLHEQFQKYVDKPSEIITPNKVDEWISVPARENSCPKESVKHKKSNGK